MKPCNDCGVELTTGNTFPSRLKKQDYYCKKCWSARTKKWFKENPEAAKVIRRRNNQKRRPENRARSLSNIRKKRYGIDTTQMMEMVAKQDEKCSICENQLILHSRKYGIDHNHKTGKLRSILCNNCNLLLGAAHDDIEILNKAINYLSKWNKNA